jgi:hypothetical protein
MSAFWAALSMSGVILTDPRPKVVAARIATKAEPSQIDAFAWGIWGARLEIEPATGGSDLVLQGNFPACASHQPAI